MIKKFKNILLILSLIIPVIIHAEDIPEDIRQKVIESMKGSPGLMIIDPDKSFSDFPWTP